MRSQKLSIQTSSDTVIICGEGSAHDVRSTDVSELEGFSNEVSQRLVQIVAGPKDLEKGAQYQTA